MFISHYNGHGIKLVRPLSTVDNTRDYARVSHNRQWSNYNIVAYTVSGKKTLRYSRHNFDKFRRSFEMFETDHPDTSMH